jgi:hypothetical protein
MQEKQANYTGPLAVHFARSNDDVFPQREKRGLKITVYIIVFFTLNPM